MDSRLTKEGITWVHHQEVTFRHTRIRLWPTVQQASRCLFGLGTRRQVSSRPMQTSLSLRSWLSTLCIRRSRLHRSCGGNTAIKLFCHRPVETPRRHLLALSGTDVLQCEPYKIVPFMQVYVSNCCIATNTQCNSSEATLVSNEPTFFPGMIEAMDDGVGLALGALEYAVSSRTT